MSNTSEHLRDPCAAEVQVPLTGDEVFGAVFGVFVVVMLAALAYGADRNAKMRDEDGRPLKNALQMAISLKHSGCERLLSSRARSALLVCSANGRNCACIWAAKSFRVLSVL